MHTISFEKLQYKIRLFLMWFKGDFVKLNCMEYDVVNGNIDDHLSEVEAFVETYVLPSLSDDSLTENRDHVLRFLHLTNFLECWETAVLEYSQAFQEQANIVPGAYDVWITALCRLKDYVNKD